MQILITSKNLRACRAINLSPISLILGAAVLLILLMMATVSLYHAYLLVGIQNNSGLVGGLVGSTLQKISAAEQKKLNQVNEVNIDVLSRKLSEMQVGLMQIEFATERIMKTKDIPKKAATNPANAGTPKPATTPAPTTSTPATGDTKQGSGGPFVPISTKNFTEVLLTSRSVERRLARQKELLMHIEAVLLGDSLTAFSLATRNPAPQARSGSPFGFRIDPFTKEPAMHTGIDFVGSVGMDIRAAASGVVILAEESPTYGKMVEIDHGQGITTLYAHLSKVFVAPSDLIVRGDKIGELGTTGRSTGPHLHLEVRINNTPVDPKRYLRSS